MMRLHVAHNFRRLVRGHGMADGDVFVRTYGKCQRETPSTSWSR